VDLLRLNFLRVYKTTFLSPKRCKEHPLSFLYGSSLGYSMVIILMKKKYSLFFNRSYPIHYHVFLVQHFMDPPKDLSEALKSKEIPETAFFTMKHGETRVIK